MIKIIKVREPSEWTEHRTTPGAEYEAKPALRNSLLDEQGFICAYCMRRITYENSIIEHIKCRSKRPDLSMNYDNMVICCQGNINDEDHCDKLKHDSDIAFSPFEDVFIDSLSYETKNGKIKSSNTQWQDELESILNLNNSLLKLNRQAVIEGVIGVLAKKGYTLHQLSSQFNEWKNPDKNHKKKEYCGIVIWYIGKKLRRK